MKKLKQQSKVRAAIFDLGVRIERLVWLDGLNEKFSDIGLFDDLEDLGKFAHPSMQWLVDAPEWAWEDEENLIEFIAAERVSGFLALVEVQQPRRYNADGSYISSWGATRHVWMYAPKPEDFLLLAMEFREKVHHDAKREAGLAEKP